MSVLELGLDELLCYSERNVSEDPDWAALASVEFNYMANPLKSFEKSKTTGSPLDKYFSMLNFTPEVYQAAKDQSQHHWHQEVNSLSSDTRSQISSFYSALILLYRGVLRENHSARGNIQTKLADDEFLDIAKTFVADPWKIGSLPGTDPSAWPFGLSDLLDRLKALPPLALWLEPFDTNYEFNRKAKNFISTREDPQEVNMALQVMLLFGFLTGNGTRITEGLLEVWDYCSNNTVPEGFLESIDQACTPHIELMSKVLETEKPLHLVKPGSMMGQFAGALNTTFQKTQSSSNSISVTSDGDYVYLFIGTQGGGKFKIGTGEGGTVCGKVYLYQALERPEEAVWVYCRGKLYMRSAFKEAGVLSIVCPYTFKSEGMLQLYCPDLFGTPAKQALNKYFPILTDSESIFVVGSRVDVLPPEEEKKQDKKEETKLCKFLLYKFDIEHLQTPSRSLQDASPLAKELYEGFSSYFSITECEKALAINGDDIERASIWLVENGDNERGKKTAIPKQVTLLCEADVVSYNQNKIQKPEISLKSNTILTPDLIFRGNWTMNKDYITLHFINPDEASATARIFAVNPSEEKRLLETAHVLPNTSNQIEATKHKGLLNRYFSEPTLSHYRGTHVANKECSKNFTLDCAGCYDHCYKKFYAFMLNHSGLQFSVYSDQNNFKFNVYKNHYQPGNEPYQEFVCRVLSLIRDSEESRYNLPWRWARWSTMFSKLTQKLKKALRECSKEEEIEQMKKNVSKMEKRLEQVQASEDLELVKKLGFKPLNEKAVKKKGPIHLKAKNKYGDLVQAKDTPTVTIYNSQQSLNCFESSEVTLRVLLDYLEKPCFDKNDLLHLLFLWSTHAYPCISDPQLAERLEAVLKANLYSNDPRKNTLSWKIIVLLWEHLWSSQAKQQEWFQTILDTSVLLNMSPQIMRKDSFLYAIKSTEDPMTYKMIFGNCEEPLLLWYLKHVHFPASFVSEKEHNNSVKEVLKVMVDKQPNESSLQNASLVMFQPEDVKMTSQKRQNLAHLLELWEVFEKGLIASLSEPSSVETQVFMEIFMFLVKEAYGSGQNYSEKLTVLLNKMLDRVQELMSERVTTLYAKWLNMFRNLVNLCVNLSYSNDSQTQLSNLLSFLSKLKKLFKVENTNLLSVLCMSSYVGADSSQEKVFETSHPYQRGKQQINETLNFPGAVGVCIEVDPKSQTDNLHDCLWISSPGNYSGFTNYSGEIFGTSFKLSGKVNVGYQLMLQGDQIHIEFNAAGQHRDDSGSNRWGFKLRVKPIYGEPGLFLSDNNSFAMFSKVAMRMGGEKSLIQWISTINSLAFTVSSMVSNFLAVPEAEKSESHQYLEWQIFKGGLANLNFEEFLTKEDSKWKYSPIEEEQLRMEESVNSLTESLPEEHKQELLNIDKGPVCQLLNEVRKVQPEPMNLRAESLRKSFTKDLQTYWRKVQCVALYTMAYHTQHLNSLKKWIQTGKVDSLMHEEKYIQEQLQAYGKLLNEILNWMLKKLQVEREKNQILTDIKEAKEAKIKEKAIVEEEKKPVLAKKTKKSKVRRLALTKPKKKPKPQPKKTEYIHTEEDKQEIYSSFSQRYLGNTNLIESLCKSFQVVFTDEQTSVKEIFDKVWTKQEDPSNPYSSIPETIHKRLLVLLKFSSYSVEVSKEEEEGPPMLKRAATSYTEEDKKKLEELRKWVDSYKKWRLWQSPGDTRPSAQSSPLRALFNFVTAGSIPEDLLHKAKLHTVNAAKKLVGMQYLGLLLGELDSTPFLRMGLGVIDGRHCFDGAECCGYSIGALLNEECNKVFNLLCEALNQTTQSLKVIKDPSKHFSSAIKKQTSILPPHFQYCDFYLKQQMKLLGSLLNDLYLILNYEDSKESVLENSDNEALLISLFEVMLVSTSLSFNNIADPVISGSKLVMFAFIDCCRDLQKIELKQHLQKIFIQTILNFLQIELSKPNSPQRTVNLQIVLTVMYQFNYNCPITRKEDQIELAKLLKKTILEITAPSVIRLTARMCQSLWKTITPNHFKGEVIEEILQTIGNYAKLHMEIAEEAPEKYTVQLHTSTCEEDLVFLFPVLLEWEERHPTYKYLDPPREESTEEAIIVEDLMDAAYLGQVPPELLEKDIPMYYRYFNAEIRGLRRRGGKRGRPSKKLVGKRSTNNGISLTKLEKIFEEKNKGFEDAKEDDSQEEKERKANEKTFIKKIRHFIKEAQSIAGALLSKGVAQVGEAMPLEKAIELSEILRSNQNNLVIDTKSKVPPIPNNPYSKNQQSNDETETIKMKKQVTVTLCDFFIAKKIDYVMESGSNLPTLRSSEKLTGIITGNYSHPLVQLSCRPGGAYSLCMQEINALLYDLMEKEDWKKEIQKHMEQVMEKLGDVSEYALGGLIVAAGWSGYMRSGANVLADINNTKTKGVLLQGGMGSVSKTCSVIFENDPTFQVHNLANNEIQPMEVFADPKELGFGQAKIAKKLLEIEGQDEWHMTVLRLLLKISAHMEWEEWVKSEDDLVKPFLEKVHKLSRDAPVSFNVNYWEHQFLEAWERLADREQPLFIQDAEESHELYSDAFLLKDQLVDDGLSGYTLPASSYLTFQSQTASDSEDKTNFRMLKYWEKYIINRIQDYVRSSFKPFEMENFFEQLRQPLRIGDQKRASDIAHVLCDQRLPSGIVLPDPKHDWSSLMVDEVKVGSWALAKLRERNIQSLCNPLLKKLFAQGIKDLTVLIRAVDVRAASLLVQFTDLESLELHMCWLPISCIYPPAVPLPALPSLPSLRSQFTHLNSLVSGLHARETLLKCMFVVKKGLLSLPDLIRIGCMQDLWEDRVMGWSIGRPECIATISERQSLQNYTHQPEATTQATPRLQFIEEQLFQGKEPEVIEWSLLAWHSLTEEIPESSRLIDIVEVATSLMGPQNPLASTPENILAENTFTKRLFPLHNQSSDFAGMVLCFQKEAFMCSNSVIQFFADSEGTCLIEEVRAGAQGRTSLPPIVFKSGKVWCTYYTFVDAKCSPYMLNLTGASVLKCKIYGIPQVWTPATWATEAITAHLCKDPSPDSISLVHSLVFGMCEFLTHSKSPAPLRQVMFRLMIRVLRRLRYMNSIHPTGMGMTSEWVNNLIHELQHWKDTEKCGNLHSSYIQDGAELVATAVLSWDTHKRIDSDLQVQLPDWIKCVYNSLVFLNYFRKEGHLTPDLESQVASLLAHDQWKTILVLKNLPQEKVNQLQTILSQYKLRIVNTKTDIQFIGNNCVVFGDGLNLQHYQETDFGEEEKKEEKEEDSKEPEFWSCAACTFENRMANGTCEMCQTPKPPPPQDLEPEEAQTNIREIEQKLQEGANEAIEELCVALRGALECEASLAREEDSELISLALKERLITPEGSLQPDMERAFEEVWVHLKDWLGDNFEEAKHKLTELGKENAKETFLKLEKRGVDMWMQLGLGVAPKCLTRKQLECLMEFAEFKICQETKAALYIPASFIRLPQEYQSSINYQQEYPSQELSATQLNQLRYNWAVLKVFNWNVSEALGLCNLSKHSHLPQSSLTLSLSSALSEARALVMLPVKVEIQQIVFERTSIPRENAPKVVLERLKVSENTARKSLNFVKAFEQLKDVNTAMLRPPKPQGSDPFISFEAIFKGELVVGESGPYRQFFADVSREIQMPNSEILCATPNNREHFGEDTDKYLIRPSAASAKDLQLFEFLGLLMGCCARTGARMTLDLPSFFWKPLVGENLRFEDLSHIDTPVAEMLKLMENAAPELFEESFENFCTRLSDCSVIDLIPNGRFIPVEHQNKEEFIQKVLDYRFQESTRQSEALREGLSKLVPPGLLNLVTWRQLEEWVCGKPNVDLDLLRRHTRYSGGLTESSQRVIWFWEILKEFTSDERLKFIKFCWGQERLPGNDDEFERTNTRLMLKPSMVSDHKDGALPKADTCFFNLELPEYSSKLIMKERLRYAFLADCESMNADNPVNEQNEAGMYRDEQFSGEEEE